MSCVHKPEWRRSLLALALMTAAPGLSAMTLSEAWQRALKTDPVAASALAGRDADRRVHRRGKRGERQRRCERRLSAPIEEPGDRDEGDHRRLPRPQVGRRAGRDIAAPAEARQRLGLAPARMPS